MKMGRGACWELVGACWELGGDACWELVGDACWELGSDAFWELAGWGRDQDMCSALSPSTVVTGTDGNSRELSVHTANNRRGNS